MHFSPTQAGVPWKELQVLPQKPQSLVDVKSASQPVVSSSSQSARLAGQSILLQLPPLQYSSLQSTKQLPQLRRSLRKLASHPAFPSQSSKPSAQLEPSPHAALMQSCRSAQALLQAPQCSESLPNLAHTMLQHVKPVGQPVLSAQFGTQFGALQAVPGGQSVSSVQPWHWCDAGSHMSPSGQSALLAQPTAHRLTSQ